MLRCGGVRGCREVTGQQWSPKSEDHVSSSLCSLPPPACIALLTAGALKKAHRSSHSCPKAGTLSAPTGEVTVEGAWRAELLGTEASGDWRARTRVRT